MMTSATIMILFASVIFFGTILNATLIGIAERRREIATFGAIGYHHHEISRIFLRENLLTNLIGTLIGLPLGYLMLRSIMTSLQTDSYAFAAALEPLSLLYTLILAIAFVLVSQIVVIRSIRALNRVEALSSKE